MSLFAIQAGVPKPNYPNLAPEVAIDQSYFFVALDLAVLVVLVIILFYLVRLLLRSKSFMPDSFAKVVLLVTVPKESSDSADQEETIEQLKNQISVAESWLATLGGQAPQKGFKAWLWGRSDHFSLEIVAKHQQISFYVATPKYLQGYMEQQILAQYPEANLTEVEDYNIFGPQSQVLSGYLKFSRSFMFPIKSYLDLNSDPLNAVTNSLSTIEPGDGIALQIIARSSHKRWHRIGSKVATELQKGRSLSEAIDATKTISLAKVVNFFSTKTPQQRQEKGETTSGLSPMQQELVKGLEEKTSKAGLDCNIRIIVSAKDKTSAEVYLKNVVNSFSQFNYYEYGNSFKLIKESSNRLIKDFIYRHYRESQKLILNIEELASLYHFPTPFLETPNIQWLLAKKLPPAVGLSSNGLLLGENIYRGKKSNIYLAPDDRRRHMYIIGMTGTGKSVLMSNLAIQDIRAGKGVCVIDPHGSLVESILESIPKERIDEVIYFNPADTNRPIGLNMLEAETIEQQDFAIQELIAIFYKLVTDPSMIGPMFEHNMRNAMLTLMADKKDPGTIVEIPRIFTDREFQRYKLGKVTDPMVRSFWEQEMAKTSDFHKSEMLGYLISKIGRFIENSMVRNIIGQPKSGFNFREIMDQQKILLVNLSKGRVGEVNSNLLGLIIVAKLQMAALSRTDIPENTRQDFYLYIDEFQNFITDSVATILAEARKYKLNLILAHQYIGQLTEGSGPEGKSYGDKIKDAIFGNVGTLMSFRIGVEDAEVIAKQMAPVVDEYDLMNIEKFNAYIRLLVDNQPRKAFNIHTFPPAHGDVRGVEDIIEFSRFKYGRDRQQIETEIVKRSRLGITGTQSVERSL
ncbi:MAG: type IV secretion system DNA-binding domain-containing protein [Candidatus Buchananbacteria bacterium]|nr:type IV secretion system DNA-binding domain-containing protein [Candidatus Buchananbacteria bacterium]